MKKLLSLLLAAAAALSLAACAGPDGEPDTHPTTEKVPVTLHVVTSYGGDDGNRMNFEAAVRSYELETGNIVKDGSATSNEEWKSKVLTDFETGSEPDVLFFFTDADAEPLIGADKLVSIEEIREQYPDYASNMKPSMMATAANGKHYAVPAAGFWENLFINRTVLSACGLEVPGPDYTWDQFLKDCQVILEHGFTPIACSLFEVPHYWFEFAVMNNGSLETQLEIPASASDPAGKKWVAALNDLKELYDRGFFPANTLTASDAETVAMFGAGEAAFLIDGSWKVGHFTDHYADTLSDFAVSYVPAKGNRKATEAIGGISMGYFITRKGWEDPETREAAVAFVRKLTSDEILSTFVTTEVTALKNGAAPAHLNALQRSAVEANAGLTGVVGALQDTITSEAKGALFANIPDVVTGAMTAEEAVEQALLLN